MRLIDADQFGVVSLQGKSEDFIEGVLFILDKIYEAPTVERPHGEWKLRSPYEAWFEEYKCSNCNAYGWFNWHFCPNCGADMRKEGERE